MWVSDLESAMSAAIPWADLASTGVDLDDLGLLPDGTYVWVLPQGGHVAFREARTETGDAAEGWNYTIYGPDDVTVITTDWHRTRADLLAMLREMAVRNSESGG